ncbi:MAG: chromosomal replication initiator protein DnaA [Eubacteriales bacterium]
MDSYKDIWKLVLMELSKRYSDTLMELWFNKLTLESLDDKMAVLTTESSSFLSILNKKYAPEIENIFEDILNFHVKVIICDKKSLDLEKIKNFENAAEEKEAPVEKNKTSDDYYIDKTAEKKLTGNENNYTFENFVVGESNKFAYKASRAVADNPTSYNPLFIYGPSGLGKTHLMKAIAAEVLKKYPDFKVIFVRGESFTNELVESLAKKDTASFKEKYRSADMLLIDDIQFIAGKVATQEEFFHTFNALYEANKQIVLTSDRPPRDIKQLEDRLRSRFESGLDVDIQPPDTELRVAILKRKAMMINLELSNEVLNFIAERIKNNIRQIEGVVKKLGAYSFVTNSPITVEIAKEQLAGFISGKEEPEDIANKIVEEISKKYYITPEDLKSKKRSKDVAMARHVAIYTIRTATGMSLKTIGQMFDRDHSTIMSSLDVVKDEMEKDAGFEHEVNSLIREFKI